MLTNGFDISTVLPLLRARVGWKQTTGYELAPETQVSKSGRFFNDTSFHSIVSLKNIDETREDIDEPPANTLDAHLTGVQDAAILTLLNQVFNQDQLIETGLSYSRWQQVRDKWPNTGKVAGMRINLAKTKTALQINTVTLAFDGNTPFNLYLFADTSAEPIYTIEVTPEANKQVIVELPDWIVRYDGQTNKSNWFYLVYFQDDLGGMQALRANTCWQETYTYSVSGVLMDVLPDNNFDRVTTPFTYENYGLLPDISVYADYTNLIKNTAHLFDEAIGLQVATNVIEQIQYGTRSNLTERITEEKLRDVYRDVNLARTTEEVPFMPGLKARYKRELEKINKNLFPKVKSRIINPC